jgi:hypothetical protein
MILRDDGDGFGLVPAIGCLYLTYEAIALPGEGLYIARVIGGVPQSVPQSSYRGIDTLIELDNRLVRPEALPNLLPRNYVSGGFEKHSQDLERLLLESNPASLFPQFAPPQVQLKWAETHVRLEFDGLSGIASLFHPRDASVSEPEGECTTF